MRIVIAAGYSGFGLSMRGIRYMAKLGDRVAGEIVQVVERQEKEFRESGIGYDSGGPGYIDCPRDNPCLVRTVEDLGTGAAWAGERCRMRVVDIPKDEPHWYIDRPAGGGERLVVNNKRRGVRLTGDL